MNLIHDRAMSILKIKDLVHKYVTYGDTEEDKQEIAAIDHIDINVEKGEFVAILGKNGSGFFTVSLSNADSPA